MGEQTRRGRGSDRPMWSRPWAALIWWALSAAACAPAAFWLVALAASDASTPALLIPLALVVATPFLVLAFAWKAWAGWFLVGAGLSLFWLLVAAGLAGVI